MTSLDAFEQDLQDALAHLYDPCYTPTGRVLALAGDSGRPGAEPWRVELRAAIDALKPSEDTPRSSRAWRIHRLLDDRYLKNLTQVESAENLGISPRHLRREQRAAVHILAERLWSRRAPGGPAVDAAAVQAGTTSQLADSASVAAACGQATEPSATAEGASRWAEQIQTELIALQQGEVPSEAEVGTAMRAAAEVTAPLAAKHSVALTMSLPPEPVMALIHPAVLRQIAIVTVCKLLPLVSGGRIQLGARSDGGDVRIEVTAAPVCSQRIPSEALLRELVGVAKDGRVQVVPENGRLLVTVNLPSARTLSVLVVDDNEDLIHVYRRYVLGTRFEIRHAVEETAISRAIDEARPDVIVLDVMLPDVDGWELLVHLHAHPATSVTPIIICSVIREAELAFALGATAYLPKPVRREEFIEALEAAVH